MLKNSETTGAYVGSAIAIYSGFTLADWAAIFGILFGLFTMLINWYYKNKEIKLKETALKQKIDLKEGDHE
ncbi:phage holin family protein [Histophilus somni]|nr:phage holin family protein [Histophilus somni]MBB5151596.1 hypothetical protein [Histophilus somni]TDF37025.1 hypothetical protein E1290_08190 [Histophilus somni]TEW26968.1 hypothetical protein E2R48_10080 [Histophilus somni]TFF00712.1 hypothetical protein E3U35_09890 [Histophilus somni]THA20853.1 hypothetical protein E5361_09005 [Histophilus somni]